MIWCSLPGVFRGLIYRLIHDLPTCDLRCRILETKSPKCRPIRRLFSISIPLISSPSLCLNFVTICIHFRLISMIYRYPLNFSCKMLTLRNYHTVRSRRITSSWRPPIRSTSAVWRRTTECIDAPICRLRSSSTSSAPLRSRTIWTIWTTRKPNGPAPWSVCLQRCVGGWTSRASWSIIATNRRRPIDLRPPPPTGRTPPTASRAILFSPPRWSASSPCRWPARPAPLTVRRWWTNRCPPPTTSTRSSRCATIRRWTV